MPTMIQVVSGDTAAALMYVGSSPQPVFSEYQCDYSPSWIDSILTH